MKLYVMYNGTDDGMPKELVASTGSPVDFDDCMSIPSTTFLIDHPEKGYILFDTGWTVKGKVGFNLSPEENIVNTLAKIGVTPEEINYLIVSHLHIDHAGNITPFVNAEFIVSENEFINVASLYMQNNLPGRAYVPEDIESWTKGKFNWHLIKEQYELIDFAEGIKLIPLGEGHAFGLIALLVELPEYGNVILSSDAIYAAVNVGPPLVPPGVTLNIDGWYKSMEYLLEVAEEYDAKIWYGHDIDQLATLTIATSKDEGYYE